MEGKRTRGKPRIKMLDRIMTEGHTKLSYDELKSAAQDRLKWRHHYQDLPTQAENSEEDSNSQGLCFSSHCIA